MSLVRPLAAVRTVRTCVQRMHEDVEAALAGDPSVHSRAEARLSPHLIALWTYRVAHVLHRSGRPASARALSLLGRGLSGGVEIHPGARIGRRLFIDHGCGTVIGETAVIGDDVTLYHQVTLGALGMHRDRHRAPGEARHPQLGSGVVIGAGAMILGPVRIGDGARVAASAFVTEDVPAGAVVGAARSGTARPGPRRRGRGPGPGPVDGVAALEQARAEQ
ncbi:MAG: serine O-acetyltransferase [Mycobacteriales bacterium]|jgi:serine O-acetyltransferase